MAGNTDEFIFLLFQDLAFCNIPVSRDDAIDDLIIQQVPADRVDRPVRTVFMLQPEFSHYILIRVRNGFFEHVLFDLPVLRVNN